MLEIKKKIAKLYKIFVIIIITYLWQKYNELELVCNQWDSTHQQSSDFQLKWSVTNLNMEVATKNSNINEFSQSTSWKYLLSSTWNFTKHA